MKRRIINSAFLVAMMGVSTGAAMAADYRQNPFTLVYEGAITENVKGKVIFILSVINSTESILPLTFTRRQIMIQPKNIRPLLWLTRTGG